MTPSSGSGPSAPRRPRRHDPRWLLAGLAASLAVFLVAVGRHGGSATPSELPAPPSRPVVLGRPDPSVVQVHVGEFLQVQLSPGPDDRYGTVLSQPDRTVTIVEVVSGTAAPPLLRAVAPGSTVVTVLLEPHCPDEGVCHDYRRDLGAVRVTVVP